MTSFCFLGGLLRPLFTTPFPCLKRANWSGYLAKTLQQPIFWSAKLRCLVCLHPDSLYSQWGSIRLNNIKIEDDLITSAPTCSPLSWNIRLASPTYLPKQFEYIARDQFDCCDQAGRGMIKLIEMVGMSNLGALWNLKLKFLDKMYSRRHQQVQYNCWEVLLGGGSVGIHKRWKLVQGSGSRVPE